MSTLLAKAEVQLELNTALALRRACWLARTALEALILDLLRAKGISAESSSERSKLSCLEGAYADERDLTFKAEFAWNRLSEACHQHAYQLAPTYSEAKHLIGLVAELTQRRELA